MPINFTDFSRAPLLERKNPTDTLFENILKGYQMSQVPKETQQRQQEKELSNKLKTLDLEHKPTEFELSDKEKTLSNSIKEFALKNLPQKTSLENQLMQANINKALRPAVVRGALADTMRLRDSLDPNSPTYKQDLAAVNNRINKLSTGQNGISISSSPEGGFQVNIGNDQQEATIPGFGKLKTGEVPVYDKQGKPLAIGKPLSEKEKKEEGGRIAFNVYRDFIKSAQAPYSGRGSNKRFQDDVLAYGRDPAAKTRIDNALAAKSLLFTTAVKEDATIGGANTNRAYKGLLDSLNNSEVFPLLDKIATFELPPGYKEASSDIFSKVLNEGSEAAKNLPAYRYSYINPQKQKKSEPTSKSTSQVRPGEIYNLGTGKWETE